jgi:hypothetical protein
MRPSGLSLLLLLVLLSGCGVRLATLTEQQKVKKLIRRLFPQIELSNRSGGPCPGHSTGERLRVAQPRRAFACA